MTINYNNYLNLDIPKDWCSEEEEDTLALYSFNGNGAMTLSFYSVLDSIRSLDEHVSILAKNFTDQNSIRMNSPFILFNRDEKTILYGEGETQDNDFIKLWVVAKHPKIVLATYISERKSKELKVCESIIDSFRFQF